MGLAQQTASILSSWWIHFRSKTRRYLYGQKYRAQDRHLPLLLVSSLSLLCLMLMLYEYISHSAHRQRHADNDIHPAWRYSLDSTMESIFVSIASYRDNQCHKTLKDMYEHAANPHRIYVGIYQQHTDSDIDCLHDLKRYDYVALENIRVKRVHASESKGLVPARYESNRLYAGESYVFQLDAHMRFVRDWDCGIITDYHDATRHAGSSKVVLTHYPEEFTSDSDDDWTGEGYQNVTTAFCHGEFDDAGMLQGLVEDVPVDGKYIESPFVADGCLFGPGLLVDDVPQDKDLPYLWIGIEFLYSVRLHAAGYKMYGPRNNYLYHLPWTSRNETPKAWDDNPEYWDRSYETLRKVQQTLLIPSPFVDESDVTRCTQDVHPKHVLDYYKKWKIDLQNKYIPRWC